MGLSVSLTFQALFDTFAQEGFFALNIITSFPPQLRPTVAPQNSVEAKFL
jgi:hypothetical protein